MGVSYRTSHSISEDISADNFLFWVLHKSNPKRRTLPPSILNFMAAGLFGFSYVAIIDILLEYAKYDALVKLISEEKPVYYLILVLFLKISIEFSGPMSFPG